MRYNKYKDISNEALKMNIKNEFIKKIESPT